MTRPLNSGCFVSGQSGNPKGRPKGLRDKRHLLNDELMLEYLERDGRAVMEVIKKHALEGNIKACTLFCQYVFFKPDSTFTINDHRNSQQELLKNLTEDQIKQIAEIADLNPAKDSQEKSIQEILPRFLPDE